MVLPIRRSAATALVVASVALAACAPTTRVHGFVPSEADVSRITPGIDTMATVEQILGRPASSGVLRDGAWYYVQSTVQSFAFNPPRVVDRTVLAVSFDAEGRVAGIDRYGIEDGRVINLTTRVTETGGRRIGILQQLFGNIVNIDPAAVAEGM
jgi:outer membrane protein assembly factor BamE (lipoprotein component of BamABCDE complex)